MPSWAVAFHTRGQRHVVRWQDGEWVDPPAWLDAYLREIVQEAGRWGGGWAAPGPHRADQYLVDGRATYDLLQAVFPAGFERLTWEMPDFEPGDPDLVY